VPTAIENLLTERLSLKVFGEIRAKYLLNPQNIAYCYTYATNGRHVVVAQVWIFSIWFVTFTAGFIPHFLFNNVKAEERVLDPSTARWASCSLDPRWIPTWQIYVQIVYALFIFLPALGIIIVSTAITVILSRRKVPSDKHPNTVILVSSIYKAKTHVLGTCTLGGGASEQTCNFNGVLVEKKRKSVAERVRSSRDRQAILQLWLIVGSFLFGYFPLTGTKVTFDQYRRIAKE